jgi:acetylornithine deacetylase
MDLMTLTKKLVGFNTVSKGASTFGIADFISEYLEGVGFKIERHPYFNETDGHNKVNLIARKGEGKTRLALSGHMDTVDFEGCWDQKASDNPLEIKLGFHNLHPKGVYYARGISDMKLFLAIAMKAGEAIGEHELKHGFALCFTSDEEVGCLGARRLIRSGTHIADYIIIGEPTEMVPIYAHKGYIYPVFELIGKKGHSSHPKNGISTIPALIEVLERLSIFEDKLQGIRDSRFDPPYPTLNIGVITTDRYSARKKEFEIKSMKNMFAEYCRIEMEVRPIPGQDSDEILGILKEAIGTKHGHVQIKCKKTRRPTPPMETSPDSPIVKIAEKITGKKAITVAYNTEGGVFNRNGSHSLVWGPGSIKQAHTRDEFVEQKYLQDEIVDIYIRAIREMCC